MHTFVRKPHAAGPAKVASDVPARALLGRGRDQRRILHAGDEIESPGASRTQLDLAGDVAEASAPALDFSRILVFPKDQESPPESVRTKVPGMRASKPLPERHGSAERGERLTAEVRGRLETILGTPLGDVRIHRGPAADNAAAGIGAPALTVGQHIVLSSLAAEAVGQLDRGPLDRTNAAGERLLAHEAAHTVQQAGAPLPRLGLPPKPPLHATALNRLLPQSHGNLPRTARESREERQAEAAARGLERPTPGAPLAIAAAPPNALPFTPSRRFKEAWSEFDRARGGFDLARIKALAKELATAPYDSDDLLNHGTDVVKWLQNNGEPQLAARLLNEVRDVWMIRFVTENSRLPARGTGFSGDNPRELIDLGKEAARAGKHDQAFRFFGVANEMLSYYALEASQKRQKELSEESVGDAHGKGAESDPARDARRQIPSSPIFRVLQYSDLQGIYDQMREIYGFYYVLEQESLAAGNPQAAADARAKAAELHKEIKDKYTWGEMPKTAGIAEEVQEPAEVAEVSYTDTRKGPGLTLYGANSAETDLTPLPGLPSPKEVGNNVQVQNLATLQNALAAQTDFQGEIGRVPEIRSAFHGQPIDLNDTAKRQKVWRIMYGVFKQSGPGALGSLMALMGRYLNAFTIHTTYNVRDWGASYLDSTLPTDLAGRAEKDCGVYALTVAWDVYQTVKHSDGKLDVKFELATMLEHVMLIITDVAGGEHYVVNNNQISPPETGDPLKQIAPGYAAVRGLPFTVGPTIPVSLGSTKDPEKKFHDQAWTQYKAAVDWGLDLNIPPDVAKLQKTDPAAYAQKVKAIEKDRYESFYREQEIFDRSARALGPQVDQLAGSAGSANDLATKLGPLVDTAGALAVLFNKLGPGSRIVAGSKESQAKLPTHAEYVFAMPQGTTVHPVARVARAVLHLKAMHGTTNPKMDALVQFCDGVPMFKQDLDAYRAAGATGAF